MDGWLIDKLPRLSGQLKRYIHWIGLTDGWNMFIFKPAATANSIRTCQEWEQWPPDQLCHTPTLTVRLIDAAARLVAAMMRGHDRANTLVIDKCNGPSHFLDHRGQGPDSIRANQLIKPTARSIAKQLLTIRSH